MNASFRKYAGVSMTAVLTIGLVAGCSAGTKPAESGASTEKGAAGEPVKLQFMVPSYAELPDMNNPYWTEWQKRTNTKLNVEWVAWGDYDTKFDLVLASGTLPEIIVATSTTRPTLLNAIKQGAFWDLTPFLGDFSKYPNLKKNSEANVWNYMKVDGKIYGLPRNRPQIDSAIKIRKDWLTKLQIPVPTTLDEFEAALKKIVASDPDGNGKTDTIGALGDDSNYLLGDTDGAILGAFGGLDPIFDKEGGLIKETLTPNYTQMIEWYRKLYAEGILSQEFSAIKVPQAQELFQTGRAATYATNIWRDYSYEQQIKKVQPQAEVITLPPMKGPGGESAILSPPFYGAQYISKKVPEEKVKQILDYYEKTTTMEFTDFSFFGIEGVHHKLVDGQPELTELGTKEVTTNTNQVFSLAFNNKMKVINPSAPKAYNDAKLKETEVFGKVGKINLFRILASDTWTSEWPKHEKEWKAMAAKAVVGQISMDEYRGYVEKLNSNPAIKKAYQEFAQKYKEYFGSGK